MAVLEIDGSFGEGGGQILRTSLALSMITRTPIQIKNVRLRRTRPGLRRQHLAALRAAALVSGGRIEGDAVNSTEIAFSPGSVKGGNYEIDIGTAGSTTLVFQTVLPALLFCSTPSTVTFIGGTHNHGGPPWDFIEKVFLPVLARMGAPVAIRLERYGFAPAGGGRWTAEIHPSDLRPIDLHDKGNVIEGSVRAIVSNLPVSIAERELTAIRERLDWPDSAYTASTVDADGPGNIIMLGRTCSLVSELAAGFGRRGFPAEKVAAEALDCWLRYENSGAAVGEHLADQLLLPMALAGGGSILTMKPTLHTTTNAEVIGKFLPVRFRMSTACRNTWIISLAR